MFGWFDPRQLPATAQQSETKGRDGRGGPAIQTIATITCNTLNQGNKSAVSFPYRSMQGQRVRSGGQMRSA
jgi:hypothetical protein